MRLAAALGGHIYDGGNSRVFGLSQLNRDRVFSRRD
jgi:hypothetical protein